MTDDDLQQTIEEAGELVALPDGHMNKRATSEWAVKCAEALVQIAGRCVVGLPCGKHAGAIHGGEAEELRSGIEKIIREDGEDVPHALREMLDEIDARDSLAFAEAWCAPRRDKQRAMTELQRTIEGAREFLAAGGLSESEFDNGAARFAGALVEVVDRTGVVFANLRRVHAAADLGPGAIDHGPLMDYEQLRRDERKILEDGAIGPVIAERDALRAENERMRPVLEAIRDASDEDRVGEIKVRGPCVNYLRYAVDAALAESKGPR